MEMPHLGLRTEEHFKAVAPRKDTPLHIFPIEWRITLCPFDETREERALEQRAPPTGINVGTNPIVVFRHHIQYFEKTSCVPNFRQPGFFTPARGVLKVDLR